MISVGLPSKHVMRLYLYLPVVARKHVERENMKRLLDGWWLPGGCCPPEAVMLFSTSHLFTFQQIDAAYSIPHT